MIRLWRSYSCNNSSSYRLIARFADATTANETAAELAEFFAANADTRRYDDAALSTLSRNYGFDWQDGGAGEQGPEVFVEGEVLIVHYAYGLGLGPGVPAYLADRGAVEIGRESTGNLRISALFHAVPGVDPQLDEALATIFAQPVENRRPMKAPWVKRNAIGRTAFFRDAGTVGMYFPIDPEDIARFKQWLAEHAIERVVIQIDPTIDEDLFLALARARCTACEGVLEYLDPRLHDIEVAQLVCKPCGGLYDLAAFLERPA